MLASSIITKVRRQIVETVGSFWSDTELLDLINDAEIQFNNELRILEGIDMTGTIQGQAEYPLPSNWLSTCAVFFNNPSITTNTPNWIRLRPTTIEKEAQEDPNFLSDDPTEQDIPLSYWLWNHVMHLDPIPNITADGNLVMFYKEKPIPLTAATQDLNLDDTFKDAITAYVLWKAWEKEKESALAESAHAEYIKGVRDGRRWVKKQAGDLRNRLDIDSPIPFSLGGGFTRGFNPF